MLLAPSFSHWIFPEFSLVNKSFCSVQKLSLAAFCYFCRWFPILTTRACCEACGNLKAAFLVAVVSFQWFCNYPWCLKLVFPGFTIPTGPVKPPPSGSGLPDRFDRKPVETGWIQIQIQNRMCKRFRPVYRLVWPVYRCFNQKIRRCKSDSPVWPVYRLPYVVGLNGPAHFFLFLFFDLTLNPRKLY